MSISNDSFKIGEWTVHPELDRISCSNGSVTLRPQVMKLLVFLASHMGKVISTEELLNQLWPKKIVTDGTVYNTLAELRNVLATANDGHTYIETIARKGYRLVDQVTKEAEGLISGDLPDSGAVPTSAQKIANKSMLALLGGLLVAVAVIFYVDWPQAKRSIAVLPFEDLSPGGDQRYFGNGIADELRLELQRLDGLSVAGRTSSITYAQEDNKTIGETLHVDSILAGSIQKEGNNVRISVHLTNVADGFTIWSKSYDRELENIFEMQKEIAASVVGALGVKLGVGAINAFRGAGTRNIEAHELYLQSRNPDMSFQEMIRRLERAIELDPDYAAAWALLGGVTLGTLWNATQDQTSAILNRAYSLTLRGVELNPESPMAQTTLAMARSIRLDWIGGEQGHRRAIELLADRPFVAEYGNTLTRNGRTAYAQEQYAISFALETLGGRPPGWSWHANVAQGRFAEAKEISNWQDAPNRIENNLDIAFNEQDPEALKTAIQALLKTNHTATSVYAPVLAEFDSPERVLSILRDVYLNEKLQWPRKLHDIAMMAAYFGDPHFALKVKGQEVRNHPTRLAAVWYPVMSDVRQLPEFNKLVIKLNLVEYWRAYGWADACRPLGENDFTCI